MGKNQMSDVRCQMSVHKSVVSSQLPVDSELKTDNHQPSTINYQRIRGCWLLATGYWLLATAYCLLFPAPSSALTVRVKDISRLSDVAENPLIGYGLVVGLAGTGDTKLVYTIQSVANMLRNFGINVNPEEITRTKNIAAVAVTATLPPFAKAGDRIDAVVSSMGDAKSLEGGTLLSTPLLGMDGVVYATAQGSVSIGGFNVGGGGGKVTKNHALAGRVPNGAMVVQDFLASLGKDGILNFTLLQPDFTTSLLLANAINTRYNASLAKAVNSETVSVSVPDTYKQNMVQFVAEVENLSILVDTKAKVVINEKTGTVVMGGNVKVSPVAVSHGNLTVTIKTTPLISQPPTLSPGQTVVEPLTEVKVKEEKSTLTIIPETNTINDVVRALNALGVKPRDLMAILQALKEVGALQAEVEIL